MATDDDMPAGASDDPFAAVTASPRFAGPLAFAGFVLAAIALLTGLAAIAGPLGMGVGLVAHVKGSRAGLPAVFASGAAMIIGMAWMFYLR
ncbi:MAG: hypothetical protein WD011_00250 [Nitriliruptoraceae bacterium]